MYGCGLRIGEAITLDIGAIDSANMLLRITGKGNKQRTIYLEKKATQALGAYLADRPANADQHVFLNYQGTHLSVRGVMDIVEKYRHLAGITKKFSSHSLRHTCATYKAVGVVVDKGMVW